MSDVARTARRQPSGESELGLATIGIQGSTRTRAKVLVCVLAALFVLGTTPRAFGEVTVSSGNVVYVFGSNVSENQSNYTLYYTTPTVIQAGVSTNMTFFVYVTELSGWKIQSQTQILEITINTPTTQVITEKAQNAVTLYQGGRWGPFNMTFDLNDSQIGIRPGQSANATIYADLVVYEAYDNPASPFVSDSGNTLKLTDVQIYSTPPSQGLTSDRLLASLGVGVAVVAALAGVAVVTRKKEGRVS
jgi:hypothetical protein